MFGSSDPADEEEGELPTLDRVSRRLRSVRLYVDSLVRAHARLQHDEDQRRALSRLEPIQPIQPLQQTEPVPMQQEPPLAGPGAQIVPEVVEDSDIELEVNLGSPIATSETESDRDHGHFDGCKCGDCLE